MLQCVTSAKWSISYKFYFLLKIPVHEVNIAVRKDALPFTLIIVITLITSSWSSWSHHHDHHHLHSACSVNCCSQVIAGSSSAVHWRLGRAVQTGVPQVWHVWQTRPHLCCAIDVTIFAQTIHCRPPLAWKGLTWEEGPETSSAFAAYFTLPRAVSTRGGRYGTVQKLFLSDASTIIGYPCHSLTHLPN